MFSEVHCQTPSSFYFVCGGCPALNVYTNRGRPKMVERWIWVRKVSTEMTADSLVMEDDNKFKVMLTCVGHCTALLSLP